VAGVLLAAALAAPAAAQEPPACPPGTIAAEAASERGRELWCERPGPPKTAHGPYVMLHPNGRVQMRGEHREGRPHGPWRSWHPDGTPSGEATFAEGKPTGMLLGWHPNGKASFVGGFRDGVAIGVVEIFDTDGRLRMALDYGADGRGRGRSAWDAASRPVDPRSPEARAVRERAIQSSRLIDKALMSATDAR
jgi:hypothetical protein